MDVLLIVIVFTFRFMGICWLTFALLLMMGCQSSPPHSIFPKSVVLQAGDLVFRRGNGLTSRFVLESDPQGHYSHVGIAVNEDGVWMVVHAVPDEPDFPGDVDRIKMEPIDQYFSSLNASQGCVLRYVDSCMASHAAVEAKRLYGKHLLFDHEYDRSDTTKMYCCELIEYAFAQSGDSLVNGVGHDLALPVFHYRNLLFPSDLYQVRGMREIAHFGK